MSQIKDAIPKRYVPKKMRENNGYLDARQKKTKMGTKVPAKK
jgi:hypothetical protein